MKVSRRIFITFSIISIVFIGTTIPILSLADGGYTFTTPLKLGDSGEEVQKLQQILNSDSFTQVALTGPGSSGNETNFFGPATQAAVIKFQTKYYTDILLPAGLSGPTGYVGSLTLQKLNTLNISPYITTTTTSTQNQIIQPVVTPRATPVTTFPPNILRLFQVSPFQARPGSSITLVGRGFTNDNIVYIGSVFTASHISSIDTIHLTISLPSTIAEGTYMVSVTNSNGDSKVPTRINGKMVTIPIAVIVTNNPKPAPHIVSVSPQTITSLTQLITIKGTGFTLSNNIITGYGSVKNLSSPDGTTLTFSLSQLSRISKLNTIKTTRAQKNLPMYDIRLPIGVDNENGPGDNQSAYVIIKQ